MVWTLNPEPWTLIVLAGYRRSRGRPGKFRAASPDSSASKPIARSCLGHESPLSTSPESFEPSIFPLLDLHCLLHGHVFSLELWVEGRWGKAGGYCRQMIETCKGGAGRGYSRQRYAWYLGRDTWEMVVSVTSCPPISSRWSPPVRLFMPVANKESCVAPCSGHKTELKY